MKIYRMLKNAKTRFRQGFTCFCCRWW